MPIYLFFFIGSFYCAYESALGSFILGKCKKEIPPKNHLLTPCRYWRLCAPWRGNHQISAIKHQTCLIVVSLMLSMYIRSTFGMGIKNTHTHTNTQTRRYVHSKCMHSVRVLLIHTNLATWKRNCIHIPLHGPLQEKNNPMRNGDVGERWGHGQC
jgi:hypothetical protein